MRNTDEGNWVSPNDLRKDKHNAVDEGINKLALFGGTFDPIHWGHIWMAELAIQQFDLDRVDFIVAKDQPVKRDSVKLSAEKRYHLVKLALDDYNKNWSPLKNLVLMMGSDIELKREGLSYSYLTIEDYKLAQPQAKLYWLMGYDAYQNLHKWKNFDKLSKQIKFIVCPRLLGQEDDPRNFELNQKVDAKLLDTKLIDISSCELRKYLSTNPDQPQDNLKDLVPNTIKDLVVDYYS